MRVKFNKQFIYKPSNQQTFVYEVGDVCLLKKEVAEIAVSGGYGEFTEFDHAPAGISEVIKKFPRKRKT